MEQWKELAELVRTEFDLEYNREAIEFLDAFIERQREKEADNSRQSGLIYSLGSFVGECIIHNYGGYWQEDTESGWYIEPAERKRFFPFNKVKKQFDNGRGDSILSFYETVAPILKM